MDNRNQLQINISLPNLINICVGQKVEGEISGEIYHCYANEPMRFSNVIEMLKEIENSFFIYSVTDVMKKWLIIVFVKFVCEH